MKSIASRRARHRFVSHEHIQSKNEKKQYPVFFGGAYHGSFFKPSQAFGQGQAVQSKCEGCEKQEEQVQRTSENREEERLNRMETGYNGDKKFIGVGKEGETLTTPTNSEKEYEEQNTRHYADCEGVSVEGYTDANYGNSYTARGSSRRSSDCGECSSDECVTNTGTVVSVFTTNPQVHLPGVPSGLNECEQRAVRNFINTTLRAHEQQHVAAFNTYRGTVRTPYTYHGCAGGLDDHTRQIHENIESARKSRSDTASAALDAGGANIFDITCECPDPEPDNE